jgi:hypothetical protein
LEVDGCYWHERAPLAQVGTRAVHAVSQADRGAVETGSTW